MGPPPPPGLSQPPGGHTLDSETQTVNTFSVLRLAEEVNRLVPELVSKLNDDMAGVGGTPATKSWPDYGQKYVF